LSQKNPNQIITIDDSNIVFVVECWKSPPRLHPAWNSIFGNNSFGLVRTPERLAVRLRGLWALFIGHSPDPKESPIKVQDGSFLKSTSFFTGELRWSSCLHDFPVRWWG
jgi:hypothetical protein